MKTTTIGSYPKPSYLRIPDWFQNEDNSPKDWEKAWSLLGNKKDELIKKACQEIIKEQETAGIDIITDGEVRRENYILYHCRHLKGIDFSKLTKKVVRSGSYILVSHNYVKSYCRRKFSAQRMENVSIIY